MIDGGCCGGAVAVDERVIDVWARFLLVVELDVSSLSAAEGDEEEADDSILVSGSCGVDPSGWTGDVI